MRYYRNRVSIVVPCKNEAEGLRKILASLKLYSNDIIVLDGHSNDGTNEIAYKEKARYFLDSGRGRGDAVRLGFKKAKNEYVVVFDADGSHNEKDIPKLLDPLFVNKADIVIGSRRKGGSLDLNMDFWGILRSGGSDFLTYLINKRFTTELSDVLYSFRALKKSTVRKLGLKANGFELEQELVAKGLKKKLRIIEIPTRENARKWGKSKLKTITGIKFILHLLKELYF